MTRNRIKLAFITDNAERAATLRRRRASMFKKIDELSTLCDVKAGTVIYNLGEAEPMVWPSYEYMKQMFEKFLSMSIIDRSQKMVTYERYLIQTITKQTEKNNREKKNNDKKEIQEIMNQMFEGNDLNELNMMKLNLLSLLADDKLKQLKNRQSRPRGQQMALFPPPPPLPLSPVPAPKIIEVEEPVPAPEMIEVEGLPEMIEVERQVPAPERIEVERVVEDGGSLIPMIIQELMNDQCFMETTAERMEQLLAEDVDGTSYSENEEDLWEDLDEVFHHIYFP
ncbi:Agamous-like MADS-box protein AGL80 [Camellia lanceoleosa]|uniref:Agamous-like MADS-box protein AGL80 n=1 Tax=Camellia lanceoleosa TaxID=1840588 RepID=A0ACC0FDC7_9ERIC|nr:Agamous-like MADS-box protein AGL80 [Camellia lanceoleosa]